MYLLPGKEHELASFVTSAKEKAEAYEREKEAKRHRAIEKLELLAMKLCCLGVAFDNVLIKATPYCVNVMYGNPSDITCSINELKQGYRVQTSEYTISYDVYLKTIESLVEFLAVFMHTNSIDAALTITKAEYKFYDSSII